MTANLHTASAALGFWIYHPGEPLPPVPPDPDDAEPAVRAALAAYELRPVPGVTWDKAPAFRELAELPGAWLRHSYENERRARYRCAQTPAPEPPP